jgi:Rrf2 family transcriptional regulator, cysteine metabolism repressor
MKLSTRSRYGLRALMELAEHYGEGAISVSVIADQQGISQKYLDTLFNSLKVAGLAMSRRGPGGGWQLTRPPSEIRLSEVLPALEGSFALVQCVDFPHTCASTPTCAAREVYVAIHDAILGVLESTTLDQLEKRHEVLEALANGTPGGADLCSPGE